MAPNQARDQPGDAGAARRLRQPVGGRELDVGVAGVEEALQFGNPRGPGVPRPDHAKVVDDDGHRVQGRERRDLGDLPGADQELQVPAERADEAGEIGNCVEAEPGPVQEG